MIIKDALAELENKSNPVVKLLHNSASSKLLLITLKQGMEVKEHKAAMPSILFVIKGTIVFTMDGTETKLGLFDQIDIPVNLIHKLTASEDSICILSQAE